MFYPVTRSQVVLTNPREVTRYVIFYVARHTVFCYLQQGGGCRDLDLIPR
jgi:hypothetical protein